MSQPERIFIDCSVAVDLLESRRPGSRSAAVLFTRSDKGIVDLFVSADTLTTLYSILIRQFREAEARRIITTFKSLVHVLPLTDRIISMALNSPIAGFEEAVQYHTAMENGFMKMLTSGTENYRHDAAIAVVTPEGYLKQKA